MGNFVGALLFFYFVEVFITVNCKHKGKKDNILSRKPNAHYFNCCSKWMLTLAADLTPLHHFYVTNVVFIEGVIWLFVHSQIIVHFEYMNRTLHFCQVLM